MPDVLLARKLRYNLLMIDTKAVRALADEIEYAWQMTDMPEESPVVAHLRQCADEIDTLRAALVSFTKSDYIKKQHPKRYAAALKALERK